VLIATISIACGFQIAIAAQRTHNPRVVLIVGILALLLVPVYYALVLLHEAAHAFAGRVVGFRFALLQVGRFGVVKDARGIRFVSRRVRKGPGGQYLPIPSGTRARARRFALVVAAGPFANLAVALLFFRAIDNYREANPFAPSTPALVPIAAEITFISIIIFVGTLLPIRTKGLRSDGTRLHILLRGGARARRHVAFSTLSALVFIGVRYRDLPSEQVETALVPRDETSESAGAHLLAYYWALDRGDVHRALELLPKASSLNTPDQRATRAKVTLELAYMSARHVPPPDFVRKLWNAAARDLCPASLRFRTAAAINLMEGRAEAAVDQAERALKLLEPISWRGQVQAEIEWSRAILERARALQATTPVGDETAQN
jgi:hypothetical protein